MCCGWRPARLAPGSWSGSSRSRFCGGGPAPSGAGAETERADRRRRAADRARGTGDADRTGRGPMKTLVVAAAGLSLLGPALGAQQRVRVTAWGDGAIVRLGTQILGARESQSGPIFGGEAGLGLGPVTLGAGDLEGRVQPGSSGTPKGRDLVEARIFVSARPVPWLTLSAGPRVRAFVTDSATERWVLWQVRARAPNALASTPLQTHIQLWGAPSAPGKLPPPGQPA